MSNSIVVNSEVEAALIDIAALCRTFLTIFNPPTPKVEDNLPRYVTRQEAATILNVSCRTVDRYIKTGKIKRYRLGDQVRLLLSDVQALVK